MRSRIVRVASVLCLAGLVGESHAQDTEPLQHYWEVQPNFGDIWQLPRSNRAPAIDVDKLAADQVQDRIQTAQLICLHHDKDNFDQGPQALKRLTERLERGDEPILVQRSMMSAACLLSDGSMADLLWKRSLSDPMMRSTVERAMVRWKNRIPVQSWRERLRDSRSDDAQVAIALEGLEVVGEASDSPLLVSILGGHGTTPSNRFLAARALGRLNGSGLNDLARQVRDSKIEDQLLLAASLLRNHTDVDAGSQLEAILESHGAAAHLVAGQALAENFPKVAAQRAPQWIAHPDSPMRKLALEILQKETDDASLRTQSRLMSDRNTEIRRLAGRQLVLKARNGQRAIVDEAVTEHLQSEAWTGIEQAIIVAAQIQDRTRCARLIELLNHPRPEVNMHAGWGLSELVHEPGHLADILAHSELLTDRLVRADATLLSSDLSRLSLLHVALGRNRYEPAESMMMQFVPKNFSMGNVCRASAIWALGQINSDKDTPELRQLLQARVEDAISMFPENFIVRFASILALGELGYSDSRDSIVKFGGEPPSQLGYASQWALQRFETLHK